MKIRFQADADLNQNIVSATVRSEPLLDFEAATALNLAGRGDLEVLSLAAREGRLLVTHDQRTMPRHFAEFIATENSAGVLVVPQHLSVTEVVENLRLIWFATEAEAWINRISYLPL